MSIVVKNSRVQIAPRKVRQVCDLVRNKKASEAVRILRFCEKKEISYKWPNDILIDNSKVSGILIETTKDNKALIKALKEGIIDVITTDHSPQDEEHKKIDFDNAANGIIGLESAFGLLGKHVLPHLELSQLIEKIAINPRKILGIDQATLSEGNIANITLFNPDLEWEFKTKDIRSKSENTPFIGERLKGKALAIFNNGKFKKC